MPPAGKLITLTLFLHLRARGLFTLTSTDTYLGYGTTILVKSTTMAAIRIFVEHIFPSKPLSTTAGYPFHCKGGPNLDLLPSLLVVFHFLYHAQAGEIVECWTGLFGQQLHQHDSQAQVS